MRTARAKGVPWNAVVWRHALRNALIPIITVVGLYLGILIGNSVLTEIVFNRPGLGKLIVGALNQRDYTMLQGMMVDLHADRRAGEPADRPHLRLRRSAGEAQMSERADARRGPRRRRRRSPTSRRQTLKAFNTNKTSWIGLVGLPRRRRARALRARCSRRTIPTDQNILEKLRPPSARALARHRQLRPRHSVARALRRAHFARHRHRLDARRDGDRRRRSACSPAGTAAASTR